MMKCNAKIKSISLYLVEYTVSEFLVETCDNIIVVILEHGMGWNDARDGRLHRGFLWTLHKERKKEVINK